jgi:8-oxo-dGTP pyrophosphatase MutT (NUDIX family)
MARRYQRPLERGTRPYDGPVADLASALTPHLEADPKPVAAPGDRLAAVLAIIVREAAPSLVLTERAARMSRHAGEVSFPGGLSELADLDLRATALRETEEELGIPADALTVLGAMDAIHTYVSATLVTPFVALASEYPAMTVNAYEIAAVHVTPLAQLAAVEVQRERREGDGLTWRGWWYELPEVTVWGATGYMVHALLELLRLEAPWTLR